MSVPRSRIARIGRPGRMPAALASVADGLRLGLLWRPRAAPRFATPGGFFLACGLLLALHVLLDTLTIPSPRALTPVGVLRPGLQCALLLLAGWLASRLLGRPALWLTLATLMVAGLLPWVLVFAGASRAWRETPLYWQLLPYASAAAMLVYGARVLRFVSAGSAWPRQLAAWLVMAVVAFGPGYVLPPTQFWYTLPTPRPASARPPPPAFDPEAVLYTQPQRLRIALDALHAQTPGKPDLYVLGFAGDGDEAVFGNEVAYLQQLFARRFNARGRVLGLVNRPGSDGTQPLATLTNLRAALAGTAAKMDLREDILLLFLTSHGSSDHRLYVNLRPLPLTQIRPQALREALDASGIRWRVVVVSACYSGGFVEALRDPGTLVITAARADRTSFGCGADADITWFRKAFLTDALNQTADFAEAYRIADKQIGKWERRDQIEASVPQLDIGTQIQARLDVWRKGLRLGAPVPFPLPPMLQAVLEPAPVPAPTPSQPPSSEPPATSAKP